ncbi:MAG: hypothetical protein ACOY3P_22435 [Planctomycetota bacterium]
MDFLNKAAAQIAELFQSMTVGARITAGLLLLAVVVSLGYLFAYQSTGPDIDLLNGMPIPAGQIDNMTVAFGKKGLNNYRISGTRILVPRAQRASYLGALADAKALPPNFGSYFRDQLADGSPFETKDQREARRRVALQDELALTISNMTGIESASVFLDSSIRYGGLSRENVCTAAVAVRPLGNGMIDDERLTSIRYFVTGAVAELKPENVTVTDLLTGRVYHGASLDGGMTEDSLYLQVQRRHEQNLTAKILGALSYVPNVQVTPAVVLDRERVSRTFSKKYDSKPVELRVSEETATHTREGAAPSGRPGYVPQQPNTAATLASSRPTSKEEDEETRRESMSVVNEDEMQRETVGLTPTRVTVAVGVPESYFIEVWHDRNDVPGQAPKQPDAASLDTVRKEESLKIQEHVATLLPPSEGVAELKELVRVTSFPDVKPDAIPQPDLAQTSLVWLGENWGTLGLILLALLSLLMLRSMIRSTPIVPPSKPLPILTVQGNERDTDDDERPDAPNRLRRFQGTGKSLRDELSDLVSEDPDVAANILKAWIGHAG